MSLPKSESGATSITPVGSNTAASNLSNNGSSVNTSNDVNGVSNGQSTTAGQQQSTTQSGADDAYRYSQAQQQSQVAPQQQYPYYSYQPAYSQQFQHSYPYYQTPAGNLTSNTAQSNQLGGAYPNYADYSRVNYAQGFNSAPIYQNQLLQNGSTVSGVIQGTQANGSTSTPNAGSAPLNTSTSTQSISNSTSGLAQANTQQITTTSTSAIGQVQPLGSRPRVTTTMWEDEKTLCYQVDASGVSVVRRADNNMINGTKLLNVAHMTRGRRDGILKSEKVRDVVKIGSMHLKGVWIPFERALAMAQREGIVDLLYPLFVRDIKQVIQQGSTTQPNPVAAAATSGAAPTSFTAGSAPQWPNYQQPQQQLPQTVSAPQSSSTQQTPQQPQYQSQAQQSTPSSDVKSNLPQQQQYASQQIGSAPQPIQQGYYSSGVSSYPYYPQYPYGSYATNGNNASNATSNSVTSGSATNNTSGSANSNNVTSAGTGISSQNPYQYPQYSYGYAPQYQNPQYDDKDTK